MLRVLSTGVLSELQVGGLRIFVKVILFNIDERKVENYVSQDTNSTSSAANNQECIGLKHDRTSEDIQLSRLLRDYSVDLVWTMRNEPIKWKKLCSKTMISRFPRADFTTKVCRKAILRKQHVGTRVV